MQGTTQYEEGSFLRGIRVLEVADELGEYCGKVLAGLGADVVKVEPLGGERTRTYGPFHGDVPGSENSLYFWHFNFGKRSVCIDLDSEEGRTQFVQLAQSADVLLDTYDVDYLPSRGLAYERLAHINPSLVYARISPFGDEGPWAHYKASDLIHLALGGVVMNCGYDPTPEGTYDTPPVAPQMWQAYQIAGELSAMSITAALYHRIASGRGQKVTTAVHEAVSKNTEADIPDWIYLRSPHSRLTGRHSFPVRLDAKGRRTKSLTPQQAQTKDGRWLQPYQTYLRLGGPPTGLVELLTKHGLDDCSDVDPSDPRYARRIEAEVGRLIASYRFDRDLWLEAQAMGLEWAPVRRPEENLADPHWARRETFMDVPHPHLGMTFREVGAKWVAPGLPWRSGPCAPRIGEHTEAVLAETRERISQSAAPSPRHARAIKGTQASKLGKPWALAGVRIVDLGWILASAGGARFLAALGAEVIKVEHSSRLDMLRLQSAMAPDGLRRERDAATAPLTPSPTTSFNRGGSFMEVNTGKRAISLNLKTARGKELLTQLIKEADVVIEGYSPGTMDRMGLGYETLKKINPRLVYVQQPGMGQVGLYERVRTLGPTAQAISGITDQSGLPEPYPPAGIGYSYLDWWGAYQVALAMLAGLYRQETTGQGCWIDSSQVEAGIYLTGTAVLNHSANGARWSRYGNRSPYKPAAPHGIFPVRGDDRWIAIAAFTEDEWHALTRVLGAPALANDPRFSTLEARLTHQDALESLIGALTINLDGIDAMSRLQEAGVPAGICQTAEDRCDWDPQLKALEWMIELNQSEIGRWPTKTFPSRLNETPAYQGGLADRHGPSYGEDNSYVYGELLGLSSSEIEQLARDGVI